MASPKVLRTTDLTCLREVIGELVRSGSPSLARAAATLETSPRSLQRHLAERTLTYSEVVDSVRSEAAQIMLRTSSLPVQENRRFARIPHTGQLRPGLRALDRRHASGLPPGEPTARPAHLIDGAKWADSRCTSGVGSLLRRRAESGRPEAGSTPRPRGRRPQGVSWL